MPRSKIHTLFRWLCLLVMLSMPRASAGFSSIYAFGDGVCTTTDAPRPAELYSGGRYCNGQIWIEKLCELRGVTYSAAKNQSYFEHTSSRLVENTNNFATPTDATNSLFIIWCANADFVELVANQPINGNWSAQMTISIENHKMAINTLYGKGARMIVIPNVADITKVPEFYALNQNDKNTVRNKIIAYNSQFESEMAALAALKPSLTIIRPNAFSFFEQVLANPPAYGMINYSGQNAIEDTNDPWAEGVDFVFWDTYHPTAKMQNALANFVNPLIPNPDTVSPVLTLPDNLVKSAAGANGAMVTFVVSANDAVDGSVIATTQPASGSVFPTGTTTVNVSASDAAGNIANGNFKVTVVDLENLLQNVTIAPAGAGGPAISGLIEGGPPGGSVILQASTDLGISNPWRDLSTIQLNAGGNQTFGPIQDPQGVGLKKDFFRIKLPLSP